MINTYVVYAVHPNGRVASTQLIATTPGAAVARTRGSLLHGQRDVGWLRGYFHVAAEYKGEVNNSDPYPEATDEAVAAWVAEQNAEAGA